MSAVIVEQHFKANKDFLCQQRDCRQCLPSGFYPSRKDALLLDTVISLAN